ncbi:MAG: tetratricopeptide repeat protein [Bacteroidales bacterium]|nr:tetratricopeptide repeat protein [Candidatus Latescibacterota bacterium]
MKTSGAIFLTILSMLVIAGAICAAVPCDREKAAEHFEKGEFDEARECYIRFLEIDDTDDEACYYLGRIDLVKGKVDDSVEYLKQAVSLDRENAEYHLWYARANLEKLQKASYFEKGILSGRVLDSLKKSVDLDPMNIEARIYLASYYLNAPSIGGGSRKKAKAQIEVISKYSPRHAHSLMAQVYVKEEKYDLAIAEFTEYLSLNPGDVEVLYALGMLYQKIKDYDNAFATFEQALKSDPDAIDCLYQIGRTAVYSGSRLDRGIESMFDYLKREVHPGVPGHDAAHWRLGMLYEIKGDIKLAVSEYETAIEMNPDEKNYRKSLEAAKKAAKD